MAQAEASEPIVDASPSEASEQPQAPAIIVTQEEDILEPQPKPEELTIENPVLKIEEGAEESTAREDDDVQFVFSAPLPKRKKRRFGSAIIVPTLEPGTEPPKKTEVSLARMEPNGEEQIAATNDTAIPAVPQPEAPRKKLADQYPANQCTASPVAGHQSTMWPPDPFATQPQLFSTYSGSVPPWIEPTIKSNYQNQIWSPMGIGDIGPRKRPWAEEDFGASNNVRSSTPVSPRTTPISMPPPMSQVYSNMSFGAVDNFRRQDPLPQNHWTNQNWNGYDLGAQYRSPPQFNPNIRPEMVSAHRPWPNNMQQPFIYPQPPQANNWIQQTENMAIARDPSQNPPLQTFQQPQVQTQSSEMQLPSQVASLAQSVLRTPRTPSQNHGNNQRTAQLQPLLQTEIFSQPAHVTDHPQDNHTVPQNVQPADMARNPSLYSVPAWLAAPNSSSTGATMGTIQNQSVTNNSGRGDHEASSGARISRSAQIHSSDGIAQTQPSSSGPLIAGPEDATSTQSMQKTQQPDKSFVVPSAKQGRKHSPNLIVDIAETAQESFPFSAVATRHGVPIQKVFDTFSAIVQLPLLRHDGDRRRHGELGKKRMKEYKDAKKAMEKAQDAEKKRLRKIADERARQDHVAINK